MLVLLWEIEDFGHLLWQGGLMDQPAITMNALTLCGNVRNEVYKTKEEIDRAREALNAQFQQTAGRNARPY
jgi:hypothetical protein